MNNLQTEENGLWWKQKVGSPEIEGKPGYIEKVPTLVPD